MVFKDANFIGGFTETQLFFDKLLGFDDDDFYDEIDCFDDDVASDLSEIGAEMLEWHANIFKFINSNNVLYIPEQHFLVWG